MEMNKMLLPNDGLNIPADLLNEINKILPGDDPLDNLDFNEIDYINKLFPTEQSLVNIDEVIVKFDENIKLLDKEIRESLHEQLNTETEGLRTLENAKQCIMDLYGQIQDIKSKAETSENMVNEITQDIRQLDQAKQNLTLSITTLNHLHMLVGGVETLEKLIPQRKYGEIGNLFQGLLNVLDQFGKCLDIPQIKDLATKVQGMRKSVGQQLFQDFKNSLGGQSNGPKVLTSSNDLYEAVKVIDIMDPLFRNEFLEWFINLQLAEYDLLFQETQDDSWLDRIEKRFTWFKRFANHFTEKYFGVFPESWNILSKIALQFCRLTSNHLSKAMNSRASEIDVKLLLYAIQKSTAFESILAEKFTTADGEEITLEPSDSDLKNPFYEPSSSSSLDITSSPTLKQHLQLPGEKSYAPVAAPISPFAGAISKCFEIHMDIFIRAQDRNVRDMVERFTKDTKTLISEILLSYSGGTQSTTDYGAGTKSSNRDFKNLIVLPSSADLFVFYKSCLLQCTQLNNSKFMFNLTEEVFKTYLRLYAQRVISANLPNFSSSSATGASTNLRELASFLKEGNFPGSKSIITQLAKSEIRILCLMIGTAEYCSETIKQLETKIKEKIDPPYKDKIDFTDEIDIYHGIISSCVNTLVQDLEGQCEPFLNILTKTNWLNCETVGDQSKYVTGLILCFKTNVPFIRENLTESRKYFTQFCTKFVSSFIPRYVTALYKCKPVGMVGAEQLLLDTHSLKTVLLDFPSIGSVNASANNTSISQYISSTQGSSNGKKPPPVSFTKIVVKGMTKAEMILKVVMTPHQDSILMFVENCLKLLPDLDYSEFQKILDIKGIKRNDQYAITECFKEHRNKLNIVLSNSTIINPNT